MKRLLLTTAVLAVAVAGTAAGSAAPAPGLGVEASCYAPAGDPAPGSPEWQARDAQNQACASLRVRDQVASPAFGYGNLGQGAALYVDAAVDQGSRPTTPKGGITTLIPGSRAADPFRTIARWTEQGRGRVAPVSFRATNGSTLRGHVFAPPASLKAPKGGFPGVVITDGSVQAFEELYFWAAEDLAASGYTVMTYDVQGQGDSDLAGDDCPGACSGVPYQQDYPFYQGAEDSLSFFLSGRNPFSDLLDRSRVGLAGHSLGAAAVSEVGQCDSRVKAIVAWDNLAKISDCKGVTVPKQYRTKKLINVPAMGITGDYVFETTPNPTAPDVDAKTAGYRQVAAAGVDAQIVTLRNATHLAYTYIPLVFQSNELGERMASYYTKAWFDLHLKGDRTGLARLTATRFDDSVDRTSIGAGVFDPVEADPGDLYAGNVPYTIKGIPVRDAVSFYYRSAYSLHAAHGRRLVCEQVRKGC